MHRVRNAFHRVKNASIRDNNVLHPFLSASVHVITLVTAQRSQTELPVVNAK